MSTPCPKCGTLLLGKVNRCWKCGTSVEEATAIPVEKFPTIRPGAQIVQSSLAHATYGAEESLVALPVDEMPADGGGNAATAVASPGSSGSAGVAADAPAEPERVGSPFAAGPSRTANGARTASSATASPYSVPAPKHAAENPNATLERATRQQVSRAGAYGVWALATLALVGMFFTSIGAACVAFLGLTFGMWGLYSDRKALALGGATLCLALFLFTGFFAATDLYIHAFGRSPWSSPPPTSAGP
ncbi:MAG TPA: hypothetical protein VGN57_05640 [Pirellulaceae bacterium]|jgi:hypothetical protein|nr:hypothetical protein [Pirellulaceae bacterium]